jgi:hypothetical protein
MARNVRSKKVSTVDVPEDVQTLANENPNVKKRGYNTDTEDAPRKRARKQVPGAVDDVTGEKVQALLSLKHSLADHDF